MSSNGTPTKEGKSFRLLGKRMRASEQGLKGRGKKEGKLLLWMDGSWFKS
jgi:hypothetical protein